MTETFILFTVSGTTYAVRSRDVAHVEMVEVVTPVPSAPPFIDGVVFSRGQVVPALNLRVRFGFERAPYDVRTRMLVVHSDGRQVGLIVDAAREFLPLDAAQIQAPGDGFVARSARYLEGIANVGDRLILVLSLPDVLAFPDPAAADRLVEVPLQE